MIQTCVLTNDNHAHLLDGYFYLWQKYCGEACKVFYGTKIPNNIFLATSLGQYPANRWSDSLIRMLDHVDKYFILMLEDYWLNDYVDMAKVNRLLPLMNDGILRIDISGNRASYSSAMEIAPGLVETLPPTPYQMSFQAAIWHRDNLRKVLRRGENPWQSETHGSNRVGTFRVLGAKEKLFSYQPVWRGLQKRWQLDKIKPEDLEYIKSQGWLKE